MTTTIIGLLCFLALLCLVIGGAIDSKQLEQEITEDENKDKNRESKYPAK